MSDPGSSLRAMLMSQSEFDLKQVRVLCLRVTAGMEDAEEAREWQQRVVDAFSTAELMIGLTALDFAGPDPRRHALETIVAMEKAAYG